MTIGSAGMERMARTQTGQEVAAPVGTPQNPSHAILTPANAITFCRLLLTCVFFALFVAGSADQRGLALFCYAVAAATDFLDGQVARRTQTVSWLGKVMDPMMDRVLLFLGVTALMVSGELPVWVAVVVIGRDVILAGGSMWLRCYQTRPMDVIYLGKVATALLMTGFVDMLLGLPVIGGLGLVDVDWLPGLNSSGTTLGMYLVYVGMVCSVITAVIYYRDGLAIRKRVRAERLGK